MGGTLCGVSRSPLSTDSPWRSRSRRSAGRSAGEGDIPASSRTSSRAFRAASARKSGDLGGDHREEIWQAHLETIGKCYADLASWDVLIAQGPSGENDNARSDQRADENDGRAATENGDDGSEPAPTCKASRGVVEKSFAEFSVTPEIEQALMEDVVSARETLPVSSCRLSVRIAKRFAQLRLDQVERSSRLSIPLLHVDVDLPCTCIEMVAEPLLGRFAGRRLEFVCTRRVLTVTGCRADEIMFSVNLQSTIRSLQALVQYVLLFVHQTDGDALYDFGDDSQNGDSDSAGRDQDRDGCHRLHFLCMQSVASNLQILHGKQSNGSVLPPYYRQQLCGETLRVDVRLWPSKVWGDGDALYVRPHTMVSEFLCLLRHRLALPVNVSLQLFLDGVPVKERHLLTAKHSTLNCVITGEKEGLPQHHNTSLITVRRPASPLRYPGVSSSNRDRRCWLVGYQFGGSLCELQVSANSTFGELEAHVRCAFEEEVATSRVLMLFAQQSPRRRVRTPRRISPLPAGGGGAFKLERNLRPAHVAVAVVGLRLCAVSAPVDAERRQVGCLADQRRGRPATTLVGSTDTVRVCVDARQHYRGEFGTSLYNKTRRCVGTNKLRQKKMTVLLI